MGSSSGRAARPQSAAAGRRPAVKVQALFGFGGDKNKEKDADKEEQFRMQQELLERRRTGADIKAAGERRKKVSDTLASRKAERLAEREALGRGEMPESLAKWKPYKKEEDAKGTGGIIVPLNPLGMRMYDEGERFDLRSPYSDDGWVDPDETDAFASIKNFWKKTWFKAMDKEDPNNRKPIIWASQWEKEKAKRAGQGKK